MKLILSNGSNARGAQMGRRNILPDDHSKPIKLQMERLKWVDGDYDQFGAYWGGGSGDNVYCAFQYLPSDWELLFGLQKPFEAPEIGVCVFVRATSREEAKAKVREILPAAKFFR